MPNSGKTLTFIKNGELHRVQSFPQAELKFFLLLHESVFPLCLCPCFLTKYMILQKFRISISVIFPFYSHISILQLFSKDCSHSHPLTVLPSSCTAVVTPYTFTLLTHKLQVLLALLFTFVLTTDHNKYIENYINRTHSEKKLQYSLKEREKIILFFLL